jgi:hypothetical protein
MCRSEGGAIGAEHPAVGPIDEALSADLAAAALMLARRVAAGARLWCLAPAYGPHVDDLAAHPVVAGAKSLPAVVLTGPDPVAVARASVRSGDVVLAVAAADEPAVGSVMRRAPAWGASTVWIGGGDRPPAGAADHVLWLADPDPQGGGLGRLHQLLWEGTQACLGRPELLTPATPECTEEVCITCSDEGRLVEVITPASPDGSALARGAQGEECVDTMLVDPVEPGDLLLVHAGTAITKLP